MNIDSHTLTRISKGDQLAFAELYNEFSSRVFNVALSYTQSFEEAEDITQDVFVKIFQNARNFKGRSSVYTWVYRIAVNTSLTHIRKQARKAKPEQNMKLLVDFQHPGVIAENKENAEILFAAMKNLIANQKMAFVLSYIEGLPRNEVAQIMDLSLKAVESLLQRAKKNMRIKLENHFPERRKS